MQRFWDKVDVRGEDDCWPWQAHRHPSGYGIFWDNGKNVRANRMALIFSGHPPPFEEAMSLHSCDNPPCCNPKHLRWGTASENTQDFILRKGGHRGENSANASIDTTAASSIMKMRMEGKNISSISEALGIPKSTVEPVYTGRSWAHLHGVDGNPTKEELLAARTTAKRRAHNRIITDAIVDDILQSRMRGESCRDIAKRLGLPLGTVSPVHSGLAMQHRHGLDGNPTFEELRQAQAVNPTHKLTEDDVAEIRSLLAKGAMGCDIAKRYGVSRSIISHIKNGKR